VATHPPDPCFFHRLPPAPHFVGRETELEALRAQWQTGFRGVLALVGLGGAGKTAVAARFLEELTESKTTPRPEGLFVWSFYQEPDAGLFLQEAYRYFATNESAATPAKGAGLLHLLRDSLSSGGPHLLVLDGLEKVQRQETVGTGTYGQLEDPLLRGLLARVAEGMGKTTVLITSRFPVTDLQSVQAAGYRHLDISGLALPAALSLLRSHGVKGDDPTLSSLVETYGAHALTLDHLGGLIGQFLDGDPGRAPEVPSLLTPGSDRQSLRLARLLRAYEEHLPPVELALLCRLCLLRRNVTLEQLLQLFLCSPAVHARTIRELAKMKVRVPGRVQPARVEQSYLTGTIQATVEEALCAAPIAGPEEAFRREIRLIAEKFFEQQRSVVECDFEEVSRLYSDPTLEVPSDQLPLPPEDRARLRTSYAQYVQMRVHPLFPSKEPPPDLEHAFLSLGYGMKRQDRRIGDLSEVDVRIAFHQAEQWLRRLTFKHFALQRVRQLCRQYQQKWTLAGPLADLNRKELRRVLDELVGRHLVLVEADGSYSVHPAVRDHFSRLAVVADQQGWHDILREQLISLIQRPGARLPEDPSTLDLAEESIYHALQAGRTEDAFGIYQNVLGGLRHLGWKLGEMARGLRILREFDPCPDRWALAWYLRALGELEAAYEQNGLPSFRADIRLLQGRLPEVAAENDSARAAVAQFLMGRTKSLPPEPLGCVVPRDQILLYTQRASLNPRPVALEGFYHDIGWQGEGVRSALLRAEVAYQLGAPDLGHKHLEAASSWILHSGSVEHLCLLHLVGARAALIGREPIGANRALAEGLHLAEQSGLGLYRVELLCMQAEELLASGDHIGAEEAASQASRLAIAAKCRFLWGAAKAGHLLGQILCAQKRMPEARQVFQETLVLRNQIGDPRASQTEFWLQERPRREV
jgi:hypothetical protein